MVINTATDRTAAGAANEIGRRARDKRAARTAAIDQTAASTAMPVPMTAIDVCVTQRRGSDGRVAVP